MKSLTAIMLALMAGLTQADATEAIKASLNRMGGPWLVAETVDPTPMEGIYRVQLSPADVIYMSADGEFFFNGDLYQNSMTGGLQNLSRIDQQKSRRELLAGIPADSGWVFAPAGVPKAVITVFTDLDCYYCQKLHQEMDQINALGIRACT